uniref:Uncharacterized protein n=1 Tax=Arion vulgaris TaxID=1028688 RepID=A0A0B6YBL3_9EUPU
MSYYTGMYIQPSGSYKKRKQINQNDPFIIDRDHSLGMYTESGKNRPTTILFTYFTTHSHMVDSLPQTLHYSMSVFKTYRNAISAKHGC